MTYDELVERVRDDEAMLVAAHTEADTLRTAISWHDQLDPQTALGDAIAEAQRVDVELSVVSENLTKAKFELFKQRGLAFAGLYKQLIPAAIINDWPGKHKRAKVNVIELRARHDALEAERGLAQAALLERRHEAQRHADFDRDTAAGRLTKLDALIISTAPEHEMRAARVAAIDEQLAPLRADLRKAHDGLQRVGSQSPRADKLRSEVKRIDQRIRDVKRKGTLNIRRVIIDGSNLCFDSTNTEVGLFALRALAAILRETTEVLVVFDATTVVKLGWPNAAALDAAMPGTDVHVASSKTRADELILSLADDETSCVLSNDRYPEYSSTAAMRDERVFGVDIIDSMKLVVVQMLDIKLNYTRER